MKPRVLLTRLLVGSLFVASPSLAPAAASVQPDDDDEAYLLHYSRAILAIKEGELERAKTELLESIELNPNYALSQYNLGYIYFLQDQITEAEEAFLRALSIDSNFSSAYMSLAILYGNEGKLAEARHNFEAAVASDPVNARAIFNLATFYLKQGDSSLAEQQFKKIASMAAAHLMACPPGCHLFDIFCHNIDRYPIPLPVSFRL